MDFNKLKFIIVLSTFLYSKIRFLFRLFGIRILKRISFFNKYISINNDIDIVNNDKKISYNNYLGNKCNNSFIELYNESILLSLNRINNLK